MTRSPSQCPGTARSSTSAGRVEMLKPDPRLAAGPAWPRGGPRVASGGPPDAQGDLLGQLRPQVAPRLQVQPPGRSSRATPTCSGRSGNSWRSHRSICRGPRPTWVSRGAEMGHQPLLVEAVGDPGAEPRGWPSRGWPLAHRVSSGGRVIRLKPVSVAADLAHLDGFGSAGDLVDAHRAALLGGQGGGLGDPGGAHGVLDGARRGDLARCHARRTSRARDGRPRSAGP